MLLTVHKSIVFPVILLLIQPPPSFNTLSYLFLSLERERERENEVRNMWVCWQVSIHFKVSSTQYYISVCISILMCLNRVGKYFVTIEVNIWKSIIGVILLPLTAISFILCTVVLVLDWSVMLLNVHIIRILKYLIVESIAIRILRTYLKNIRI